MGVEEHEQERKRATELVHHMVAFDHGPAARPNTQSPVSASQVAYRVDNGPMPPWPAALIAVASGTGLRRRNGSHRLAHVRVGVGERGTHR